eukprot:11576133-Alexandrium_andersonii.AAC.1
MQDPESPGDKLFYVELPANFKTTPAFHFLKAACERFHINITDVLEFWQFDSEAQFCKKFDSVA